MWVFACTHTILLTAGYSRLLCRIVFVFLTVHITSVHVRGFVGVCVCVGVRVRVQQRKWRQASVAQLCLALMPLHSPYSHPASALTAANLLFILKVCSALWCSIQTGTNQRYQAATQHSQLTALLCPLFQSSRFEVIVQHKL